jgi:hypothetical protein
VMFCRSPSVFDATGRRYPESRAKAPPRNWFIYGFAFARPSGVLRRRSGLLQAGNCFAASPDVDIRTTCMADPNRSREPREGGKPVTTAGKPAAAFRASLTSTARYGSGKSASSRPHRHVTRSVRRREEG